MAHVIDPRIQFPIVLDIEERQRRYRPLRFRVMENHACHVAVGQMVIDRDARRVSYDSGSC